MIEVKAELLNIPKDEPKLSVGIILSEDNIHELNFTVNGNYKFNGQELISDKIEIKDGKVLFQSQTFDEIYFSKSEGSIIFKDLVVGRSFHWKDKYNLEFTGDFKIVVLADKLCVVNMISFEEYLACVISSEMSASAPLEYCKAQAIVARSWAYIFLKTKHENLPYTICNDDCCQRYQGLTFTNANAFKAISECSGLFVVNSNEFVVPTYYSKSCGGTSEDSANVFGYPFNGLDVVRDGEGDFSYCDDNHVTTSDLEKYLGKVDLTSEYYKWNKTIDLKHVSKVCDLGLIKELEILKIGDSGRILKLNVIDENCNSKILESQYEIRQKLDPKFLYSSAFKIVSIDLENQTMDISGGGWGHGVGFCQIGGLGMALKGFTSEQIIKHYFPKTRLIKAY